MSETFASMGGNWIEERFDPAQKKAFLEQFANFEEVHLEKDYSIDVHFKGDFDPKVQRAIEAVAGQCIDFALEAGIELYHTNPKVILYTASGWKEKSGSTPLDIELPAAKIEDGLSPEISIIIPDQVKSSEEVIKTVRLLCSKLFGSLFFQEHVPRRPPYALLSDAEEEVLFDFGEKLSFVEFLEVESPLLQNHLADYAKKIMIRGAQGLNIAKKEFFKVAKSKPSEQDQAVINKITEETIAGVNGDADGFYDLMTDKIFAKIPQSYFILPHEKKSYEFQKGKRLWTIFHALEDRLQQVCNSMQELLDCRAFLQKSEGGALLEDSLVDLWISTLKERNRLLIRKSLVKVYLFDTDKLSNKQQHNKVSFPLWLWKRGLLDDFPPKMPSDLRVKKMTEKYKNTIYQKIFEANFRIIELLQGIKKDLGQDWQKSNHYARLKVLYTGFEIRQEGMMVMMGAARVAKGLQGAISASTVNKTEALAIFEEGWAYFVSYALIHKYYQQIDQKKKDDANRAGKFQLVIEKYISARTKQEAPYRVAELFTKFYSENGFSLAPLAMMLKEEAQTLDFFVQHQAELFEDESKDSSEVIGRFSGSLGKWATDRYQNRITEEERKSFHSQII